MSENRTIFLDNDDMAYGVGFDRIEQIQIPSFESIDINDAIEFFEIKRYFDNGLRVKDWSDEQYSEYCEKSKKLFGITMRFVKGLKDSTILEVYRRINGHFYHKPFWILFDKCSLYNEISPSVFDQLLHNESVSLYDILSHKKISKQYGMVIRDYILETLDHIPLLLQVYEQDYIQEKERLYLPAEFSEHDVEQYFQAYIESDFPNLNYLESIVQMRPKSPFCISDSTKLKAKRRYEEKSQEVFENGISYEYGLEIVFLPKQEELKLAKDEGRKQVFSYSQKWLQETLDFPNVLENFIYVFEFIDVPQMRCLLVAKESQSGVLERAMHSKSERIYPQNRVFKLYDDLSNMQMHMYYRFLKNNGIRLETVLEWFFTECLQDDFGCPEMRVALPSDGASYLEKCISICSASESIRKQFCLYCEHKDIDFELLELSTKSIKIDEIPSLVDKKYVYGIGKDFKDISFILFSDQCMFSFVKRIYNEGRSYDCVFELIENENVYLSDYRDYEQMTFLWLAEQELLTIAENGLIKIGNRKKVTIVKDLFDNEVISYWHYSSNYYSVFEEWIEKGYLETQSTLLSRPEARYFNYMLNDSEFDNGPKLRNKYSHGNQSSNADEKKHQRNYLILLKLFIVLAIKINDDFSLKEQQEQMNQEA